MHENTVIVHPNGVKSINVMKAQRAVYYVVLIVASESYAVLKYNNI
jgi:hypothetical protein